MQRLSSSANLTAASCWVRHLAACSPTASPPAWRSDPRRSFCQLLCLRAQVRAAAHVHCFCACYWALASQHSCMHAEQPRPPCKSHANCACKSPHHFCTLMQGARVNRRISLCYPSVHNGALRRRRRRACQPQRRRRPPPCRGQRPAALDGGAAQQVPGGPQHPRWP